MTSEDGKYKDDPDRDFRDRYTLPEHFVWDPCEYRAIVYDRYVELALGLLPSPPCRVLDVGCGDGWVAGKMVDRGYRVSGIDYNDRAIGFATVLVPKADFEVADIRDAGTPAFAKGGYDAAVCIEVLEHLPPADLDKVLRNLWNSLRPGGTFVMTVPSTLIRGARYHYKHFTHEELTALIGGAGFGVRELLQQAVPRWARCRTLWRLLQNRVYDLRFARMLLRKILMHGTALSNRRAKACRFIVKAVKEPCAE